MNKTMSFENNARLIGLVFLIFFPFLFPNTLFANDVLEKRIHVAFSETPLKTALDEVARLGGFEWSYNTRIIDTEQRVSLPPGTRSVRETLLLLLGDDYTFKQSGEYLILKKNKKPQQKLSGYISDPRTGQKISNVTVYDRQTLRSATTNVDGFYELPVSTRAEIVVSRLDYRDTVLQITSMTPRFVKIELQPDTPSLASRPSLRQQLNRASLSLENFFVKTSQKLAALNVDDSLHRRFQLSFLPGIGTNHRLSGSVVNDWSVNILAGYSRGNRKAEIAGLGNITRENMTGFQGAGLFNNLRGNASGVQAAGIYNYVGDTLQGAQMSGILNVAHYGEGVQAAGILNIVPHGRFAVQAAGIANQTDTMTALQAAGIWNSAKTLLHGVQASGIGNHAASADAAAQFAGLTNSAGRGKIRVQVAGLSNVADSLHGTQISGLFNYARHLEGAQIGVINIAKENKGLQLGLLNISKRGGYIALEANANDVMWANLSFKSGVPTFYVTLTAGAEQAESEPSDLLWGYGVGFGSSTRFNSWCGLTFDLTNRHVSHGSHANAVQEWVQIAPAVNLHLVGGLHIAVGPTFNFFISDPTDLSSVALRSRVVKNNLLPADAGDGWLGAWLGWSAGLRWRF